MKKKAVRRTYSVEPGTLLISEPFNPEPLYKRAVILISQHSKKKGTIGFIINKPTELRINDAMEDFPKFNACVYWGGPLKLDSIYYLHSLPQLEDSIQIAEGLYWGGNYYQLKTMIESGEVNEDQIKFIAGYTSWQGNDLEQEIKGDNWWVTQADQYSILIEEPTVVWGNVLQRMGHVYGILNNFPVDPEMN